MAEPLQIQLNTTAEDSKPIAKPLIWWIQISIYAILVLAGQSTAVILGRLYFDKGGKGKWISTLVQVVGFPVLLPLYYLIPTKKHEPSDSKPSSFKLGALYITLGLLVALDCMLYTIGLLYLPVSTYSLICASQLAFNALFAIFLKTQNFTPYIVNSVVLLTISSTLLVFQNESSNTQETSNSKAKYILGFVCTVGASAIYGLLLPLTQLALEKVIKRHDIKAILDLIVYESLVASLATVVGLLASGEWKKLNKEMGEYELGRVSYVMTLVWIALCWQIYSIGSIKLIAEVSSLFSNVISTLGLPVVPVLAVFIFHDKMDGIKGVAMALAVWGFISYAYQCYGDNCKSRVEQGKTGV